MGDSQPPAQVGLGSHIEVDLIDEDGNAERMTFDLVPASHADMSRGLLSADAPLGKAVRGKFVGATIAYQMGDIRQVRIVRAGASTVVAPPDAEARRADVLKRALDAAERTNAQIFAASYSGKWGDYDPDGVEDWDE